jgi:hypothetical protein
VIAFLINKLPGAIRQDHALHDQGNRPPASDFGKLAKVSPGGPQPPETRTVP